MMGLLTGHMIGDAAISVRDLEKSFKDLRVLDGISLTVQKGRIFALLGSNGAGKTTTIKILTTLLKPDSGSARVCGFDVVRQPERVREKISMTGQYTAVDGILTGKENLRMIGKLRHLPDVEQKSDELLERFQLRDAADRRAGTYSGGMLRRLDLAMGFMGSPTVVFLDEPTAGLDPQSRLTVWRIIKDLSRSGVTVFLTTQYLEEADQLADRIAILNEGKIVAEGTAADLKKMLPHGHIELELRNEKEAQSALDQLGGYDARLNARDLTVTIATDGTIKELTGILNLLENGDIPVAEFSQKLPTLEDVFLAVVGENQEKEEVK